MAAEPRIRFLLGGAQKAGTTAMARYLARHPGIALPLRKEGHVFDAADFDEAWTVAVIDARFAAKFGGWMGGKVHGDATPLTMFHPLLVRRVARYNPAMRWVVLLRDPVERAISHYFMERARGAEPLGLMRAILAERARLCGHGSDFSAHSPLRKWSYVARGRYARQLDALMDHFPRDQVLLLRSQDLLFDPGTTVARTLGFLGFEPMDEAGEFPRVFQGNYPNPGAMNPARLLLRWKLRGEVDALRARHGIDLREQAHARPG